MALARTIWRLMVGIKDALALLFLLLFFGLVWAALSFGDAPPATISDGVLDLDLSGTIVEQPSRASLGNLAGGGAMREIRARDLLAALDEAAGDDRVKAVALDLDRFAGGGQVDLIAVGEALGRVRAKGKPVLAYANYYTDPAYLLAAHASEVWIDPMGAVVLRGKGGSMPYFKGLADRLGVTMHIYKVGTYKSAVEPLIRTDMSEPARDNAEALVGALQAQWLESVAKARPAARAGVEATLMQPAAQLERAGGDFARAALAARLVDKVGGRNAFDARLAALGGKAADDEERRYRRIDFADYADAATSAADEGAVAVVTVAGNIVDGRAGPGSAGGDSIAALIGEASRDPAVRALVLRVDSPGGSVPASEVIHEALMAFAAEGDRPIVVSMANIAASGGYWIATPAKMIVAEPSTLTGSIGVFGVLPSFEKSLAKLGITADGVATAPLSGQPDVLKGVSPESDRLLQAGVEATYRHFLARVAKARGKTPAEIDRVAQGRVWDGGTARQIGLVDRFGGLDVAVEEAARLAKLDGSDAAPRYFDPPMTRNERLARWLADEGEGHAAGGTDGLAALSPSPLALLETVRREFLAILMGSSIQARCLECAPFASPPPAPVADAREGWLARLLLAA